jgi:hypothetical protein
MYSLLCDGKLVRTESSLTVAIVVAKAESLVNGNCTYKGMRGRMISVWSGPIVNGRGVTKHALFACGNII